MFQKWDIVYAAKFPDTCQCTNSKCGFNFSVDRHNCPHCGEENIVSHLIGKPRPVIVWIDQANWVESMAFGIPTSAGKIYFDKVNEVIGLNHYQFLHKDQILKRPMRAVISQATRIDGNALPKHQLIGRITDSVVQQKIQDKLFNWIFP